MSMTFTGFINGFTGFTDGFSDLTNSFIAMKMALLSFSDFTIGSHR